MYTCYARCPDNGDVRRSAVGENQFVALDPSRTEPSGLRLANRLRRIQRQSFHGGVGHTIYRRLRKFLSGPFSSPGNEQIELGIGSTSEEGKLRLPLRYAA